jgi:hypothetical protein
MSYDLLLYKRKGSDIAEHIVADYLNKNLPFNNSEYNKQWAYENPETGVYFIIDWNDPSTEDENIEPESGFEDFENLNFSININFIRPTYFGLEIFPIIEKIVKDLDLFILNWQDESDAENPKKFDDGYLQDQWIRQNDKFCLGMFEEFKSKFMHLEKSNYMWWYMLNRQELEDSIKEDIYVPRFFIIQSHEDNELYTACVWPDHIPILLPVVDYVIIKRKYKKFFKTVEEDGLVSYKNVIQSLGNYFEEFDYPVPHLKKLDQTNADKMTDKFNKLKIYKSIKDFGSAVGKDGFVNVRPE